MFPFEKRLLVIGEPQFADPTERYPNFGKDLEAIAEKQGILWGETGLYPPLMFPNFDQPHFEYRLFKGKTASSEYEPIQFDYLPTESTLRVYSNIPESKVMPIVDFLARNYLSVTLKEVTVGQSLYPKAEYLHNEDCCDQATACLRIILRLIEHGDILSDDGLLYLHNAFLIYYSIGEYIVNDSYRALFDHVRQRLSQYLSPKLASNRILDSAYYEASLAYERFVKHWDDMLTCFTDNDLPSTRRKTLQNQFKVMRAKFETLRREISLSQTNSPIANEIINDPGCPIFNDIDGMRLTGQAVVSICADLSKEPLRDVEFSEASRKPSLYPSWVMAVGAIEVEEIWRLTPFYLGKTDHLPPYALLISKLFDKDSSHSFWNALDKYYRAVLSFNAKYSRSDMTLIHYLSVVYGKSIRLIDDFHGQWLELDLTQLGCTAISFAEADEEKKTLIKPILENKINVIQKRVNVFHKELPIIELALKRGERPTKSELISSRRNAGLATDQMIDSFVPNKSSVVLPKSDISTSVSSNNELTVRLAEDQLTRLASTVSDGSNELKAHVTSETDRGIAAKTPKRGGVTKGTPSSGRVPALSPRKEHVLNESKITCWLHDRAFDLLGLTEAQRRAAMKRDFTGRKIAAATRVREATVGKIVSLRARSLGGGTLNESAAQLYYLICNDPDLFDLFAEIERRHKPPRRNKDVNEHARRLKTEIEAELRRR